MQTGELSSFLEERPAYRCGLRLGLRWCIRPCVMNYEGYSKKGGLTKKKKVVRSRGRAICGPVLCKMLVTSLGPSRLLRVSGKKSLERAGGWCSLSIRRISEPTRGTIFGTGGSVTTIREEKGAKGLGTLLKGLTRGGKKYTPALRNRTGAPKKKKKSCALKISRIRGKRRGSGGEGTV